eukprot:6440009-Prymnesium_polylepis.1
MAVWCGPCQLMAPQLEEVAKRLEGKCRVLKVDSDEEPDVANTLQVRARRISLGVLDLARWHMQIRPSLPLLPPLSVPIVSPSPDSRPADHPADQRHEHHHARGGCADG